MDARKGNIYEILNGNKQFLIPVYQRFYSWDIDQCKRLWNDIVEMQRKGSDPKKLDLKEKQKHSCFSFFMQYFQAYIEPDFSNSI